MQSQSTHPLRLIQLAACLGFIVVVLDVSVVNVALESLQVKFHATLTGLQWVVNAYALVFAALLLTAGALSDRFGARHTFMSGFAIFTLGSAACGLAPTLEILITARTLQGLGAALLVPASLSLLRQIFLDSEARNRAVSWWAASGGIGLAAGPVIGGILIASIGWRAIFLINLPLGLLGLWVVGRYAPHSLVKSDKSLDMMGQAVGALALASLTLALTEASHFGWGSGLIITAFAAFLMLSALFLWLERRNPSAMLPLSLFRNATLCSATIIGLIANLTFYGTVFTLSLYFQFIHLFTPLHTGLAFLPMMGILVVCNLAAGRLVGKVGARRLAVAGLLLAALGYLLFLPGLRADSYPLLILPMLIAGGGIALTIPTITNASLAAVSGSQAGIASGLLNASRQIGGVVGVAIFGFMVRNQQHAIFMHGLEQVAIVSALLLVAAAGVALRGLTSREAALLRPVPTIKPTPDTQESAPHTET